jgi:hypothetical protein
MLGFSSGKEKIQVNLKNMASLRFANAARFCFENLKVLGKAAQHFCFWKCEKGLTNGQALANEANKGVMVMTETNMLGVNSWVDNTQDLEQQQREISEKLHFSRMMAERQQVLALENEITEDRKRVSELRSLAYATAVENKPIIEKLKLETARLISESISIDNESVMLEQALRAKHQELADLRQQIEADKIVG